MADVEDKQSGITFNREGLVAVRVSDGYKVTLKEPNEETKGLDWFELPAKGK